MPSNKNITYMRPMECILEGVSSWRDYLNILSSDLDTDKFNIDADGTANKNAVSTTSIFTCIVLWDLIIVLSTYSFLILVSSMSLLKHKWGKYIIVLLMIMSLFHPVILGTATAACSTYIMSYFGYDDTIENAAFYSLFVALVLNMSTIFSSLFLRKTFKFV